jgi:hypothetical protein
MRRLALAAIFLLIGASPVLDSYAPPQGWKLVEDREIGGGNERVWRHGNDFIRRYVVLEPFRHHTADDIRRGFTASPSSANEQITVDSVVRQRSCGNARESWAVNDRISGFDNFSSLTVIQYSTDYQILLAYDHPIGQTPDASAAQSILTYCAPSDTPQTTATAIPASPPKQSETADENGPFRLFGFSYRPPAGWKASSVRSTVTTARGGNMDFMLWDRGSDTIILGVSERSTIRVRTLNSHEIENGIKTFAQDVSVLATSGCAGRPIVIAEYKLLQRTLQDPFDKESRYITQVRINGQTNDAYLEYRRSSPPADPGFTRSINSLCFHASSAIASRQFPLERLALPSVKEGL